MKRLIHIFGNVALLAVFSFYALSPVVATVSLNDPGRVTDDEFCPRLYLLECLIDATDSAPGGAQISAGDSATDVFLKKKRATSSLRKLLGATQDASSFVPPIQSDDLYQPCTSALFHVADHSHASGTSPPSRS